MKISGVYKITNTVTNDFYIGSSKDVKHRLANHKCPSIWKKYQKKYQQSDKYKECQKKYKKQLCLYNGEILTLNALSQRFIKAGIENSALEAKKYLF